MISRRSRGSELRGGMAREVSRLSRRPSEEAVLFVNDDAVL